MIRAVIVDDEPPARRKLLRLLSDDRDIQIVGEAGSAAEAVEAMQREQPDLVFLDIQMPDASGFDVVEQCANLPDLHYVFVTAYDDFAVKAFEVHALDYLLKPVEPSRFTAAMQRVKRLLGKRRFASGQPVGTVGSADESRAGLRAAPADSGRRAVVLCGDAPDRLAGIDATTCVSMPAAILIRYAAPWMR